MKTFIITLFVCATSAVAQTFHYDAAGRLVRAVYSNGTETRYTYDKNGNLLKAKTDVINSVSEESSQKQELQASPQPSSTVVRLTGVPSGSLNAHFIALNGEVVSEVQCVGQNGAIELDVRSLASGTYTVKVVHKDRVFTASVVVRH